MIFHLQFEARTSVCPPMCVYIFQPRHCFFCLFFSLFFSGGEWRISHSILESWEREEGMFHVLSTIGLEFCETRISNRHHMCRQDKVSRYFQLKGFQSWTIQDFSLFVQVSLVSGRKNLLDIFLFPVDWTNWDLNILMSHMTPFNSRGFSAN